MTHQRRCISGTIPTVAAYCRSQATCSDGQADFQGGQRDHADRMAFASHAQRRIDDVVATGSRPVARGIDEALATGGLFSQPALRSIHEPGLRRNTDAPELALQLI